MDDDIVIEPSLEIEEDENNEEKYEDDCNEELEKEFEKEYFYSCSENFLINAQNFVDQKDMNISLFHGKENIYDFLEYLQNKYKK